MIYEVRKEPHSDMQIREFLAKYGLEDAWVWIRTNILGQPITFISALMVCLILFLIARKCDSLFMQILCGFAFFFLLIAKVFIV
jgi:hypothetical protein